jgi:hypothetical protein
MLDQKKLAESIQLQNPDHDTSFFSLSLQNDEYRHIVME